MTIFILFTLLIPEGQKLSTHVTYFLLWVKLPQILHWRSSTADIIEAVDYMYVYVLYHMYYLYCT